MDRRIWKFKLCLTDRQTIEMPKDSIVLSVGIQRQSICLWAIVDTEAPPELRTFVIVGTGNPFDGTGSFIGTVQDGGLVWHIFEGIQ